MWKQLISILNQTYPIWAEGQENKHKFIHNLILNYAEEIIRYADRKDWDGNNMSKDKRSISLNVIERGRKNDLVIILSPIYKISISFLIFGYDYIDWNTGPVFGSEITYKLLYKKDIILEDENSFHIIKLIDAMNNGLNTNPPNNMPVDSVINGKAWIETILKQAK